MNIRLGDTHTIRWNTSDPATGAAANASAQTVSVYEESNDTPIVNPSAVNVSTGHYKADIVATTANGFEAGKVYSVGVDATVGGVACKGTILTFEVNSQDLDDAITLVQLLEGSVNVGQALRAILDAAAADTVGFPASPIIKSLDGTKNRIEATLDINRNRTVTARDLT